MKEIKKYKVDENIPGNAKFLCKQLGEDYFYYEVPIKSENQSTVKDELVKETIVRAIDYLNKKTGSKYTYKVKAHNSKIRARLNEGAKPDHFKTVIDNMCSHWLDNDRMRQYLRPETLFSTKFWGYLSNDPETTTEDALKELDKYLDK